MKTLFPIIIGVCLTLSAFGRQFYSTANIAFLQAIAAQGGASLWGPTNAGSGIVANFDATLVKNLGPYGAGTNSITDTISAQTFKTVNAAITNAGIGWFFNTNTTGLTNPVPIALGTTFSLEIGWRQQPKAQPANGTSTSDTVTSNLPASMLDNTYRPILTAADGDSIGISNNLVLANHGGTYQISTAAYPTTNWICPTYDIVITSAGTIYTNGVVCGTGLGTFSSSFQLTTLGSTNVYFNPNGYLQALRAWNVVLSSAQVAQLAVWNITNNSPFTNGCIVQYPFQDGSGAPQSTIGNFPFTFAALNSSNLFANPQWTNGDITLNNTNNKALYFNNAGMQALGFTNGWSGSNNVAVSFWWFGQPATLVQGQDHMLFQANNNMSNGSGPWPGWGGWVEFWGGVPDISFYLYDTTSPNNYTESTWDYCLDSSWHFIVNEVTTNGAAHYMPLTIIDGVPVNNHNGSQIGGSGFKLDGDVFGWGTTNSLQCGFDYWGDQSLLGDFMDDIEFYTNLPDASQIAQKLRAGPK